MGQSTEAIRDGENDLPLRRAAIKVLRPEYVRDRQMASRFLNEARAIDAVDHPGVVTIYDIGVLHNGAPYLAMGSIWTAKSLRARLQTRGITSRPGLRIAEKLAQTLAAVHDKKIIHRDLKPENVMLLRESPDRRPCPTATANGLKVLDFGIARCCRTCTATGK